MCRNAALALDIRRRRGAAHFVPYCEYAQCRMWRSRHAVGEHAVCTAYLQSDSLHCMHKEIGSVWRSLLFARHSSPHRARCQIRVPNWKATSCGVWSRTGPFAPHFPSSPDILFRYIKVRMEMRWLPFSSPYIPRPQICQEKGTATKFNTTPLSRQLLLLYIQ